jgi:transcriptional regulator with XRE-family HTH domain
MNESAANPADEVAFLRALGKRVRLLRLIREMTQDELAQASGISRSFVSLIENGAHGIDVVRLWRLAAVFGMSLTELVDVTKPAAALNGEAA